jgi:hypothetical protein
MGGGSHDHDKSHFMAAKMLKILSQEAMYHGAEGLKPAGIAFSGYHTAKKASTRSIYLLDKGLTTRWYSIFRPLNCQSCANLQPDYLQPRVLGTLYNRILMPPNEAKLLTGSHVLLSQVSHDP